MDKFAIALKQAIEKTQKQQGLATHNENSTDCMYRGNDGNNCPVGHMIADEHYDESFEFNGVVDHEGILPAIARSIGMELADDHRTILIEVQDIHDQSLMEAKNTDSDDAVETFVNIFKDKIDHNVDKGTIPKYCIVE